MRERQRQRTQKDKESMHMDAIVGLFTASMKKRNIVSNGNVGFMT